MVAFRSLVVAAVLQSCSLAEAFSASAFGTRRSVAAGSASRRGGLSMNAALIVQNKGGGHGELGYQLAKVLSSDASVSSVTILQDDACKDASEPFASYASDLPDVTVVKAPLSSDEDMTADDINAALGGKSFEYVFDNASKGPKGAGKAIADCSKAWGTKVYTYVSSAGAYTPDESTTFPMSEATTPTKDSGQIKQENYAAEIGLPLVSFRPQYIYGPKANKYDYIDWYFDRIVRELPLPIPGDGTQLVSLTNAEDVAALLACSIKSPEAAIEQRVFNCGTDKLLSYNEVAYLCADAAGVARNKVMLHHYDAELYGKGKFPFRPSNFYVAPDVAKAKIGFPGAQADLGADLKWYYEGYLARGGDKKEMSWQADKEITFMPGAAFEQDSIYDKYDPLVVDMSAVDNTL